MGDGGRGDREGTGGSLAGDWSSCVPKKDAGGDNKKKTEDCCFACVIYAGMTSQVYGGGDIEQVRVLREYRDNVLMQDELGKKFVKWYYDGGGKRMSEFVRGKGRFLIPIIRKGLDFIVEDYEVRK